MQYKIYTRGKTVDYKWSAAPDYEFHEYLGGNGIVVARANTGTYTVYLVSEPSSATDSQGRRMRICVLITECTEWKAKGIAVWALENWNGFCTTFERFVKDFGFDAWEADTEALEKFFNEIPGIDTTGATLIRRSENGNTPENRKVLADEIKNFDFSQTAGFKLAVDGALMTGGKLKTLQEQVQRYLTGDGSLRHFKDDLPKQEFKPEISDMSNFTQLFKRMKKHLPCLTLFFISFMMLNEIRTIHKQIEELQKSEQATIEEKSIDKRFENLQNEIKLIESKISGITDRIFETFNEEKNPLAKDVIKITNDLEEAKKKIDELRNEYVSITNRLTIIELCSSRMSIESHENPPGIN